MATDIYLEKYLPYNTFVKFIEVLNIALDIDQVKRLENYVAVSLQNYLAEILLDMGR